MSKVRKYVDLVTTIANAIAAWYEKWAAVEAQHTLPNGTGRTERQPVGQ